MVTGRIQSSDFTTEDLGSLSADQAIDHFKNHDWATEFEQQEKLLWEGRKSCPAGVVFKSDKDLLRIEPESEDTNWVLFLYQEPKTILGIIPVSRRITKAGSAWPNEECHNSIRLFFHGDYDELKREVARQ